MDNLRLTEDVSKTNNIDYIIEAVKSVGLSTVKSAISENNQRVIADFECDLSESRILRRILSEKIAEVICVGYKYEIFNHRISSAGLNSVEREILLSAIIAADFDDDKRFVKSKTVIEHETAIDGLYNFRLQPLMRKWEQIASYIPQYFALEELKEFVSYLINEKKGRKVYVENGNVYDSNLKLLSRNRLIPNGSDLSIVKEALLSGAGEVVVSGAIDRISEGYLYKYFGNKVSVVY